MHTPVLRVRDDGAPRAHQWLRNSSPLLRAIGLLCLLSSSGCLAASHGISRIQRAPTAHELVIELQAVDLDSSLGHHAGRQPPPLWTTMPETGWLQGFTIEVVDERGDTVPSAVLHHFKLIAPDKRELFKPIMLRLIGAGAETRGEILPTPLGFPLQAGDSLLATAMLHNETGASFQGVRVRARLRYVPATTGKSPLVIYPFFMHVTPPEGHSGYDLPPGRSERSWEARPAIAGRILGFGGHIHRYGTELRFEDATTGRVLWRTRPRLADDGEVIEIPRRFYIWSRGIAVRPDHVYRVTAVYYNPTGETIADGGMGTIGGVIQPASPWPSVNRGDPLYAFDRARELENGHSSHDHSHHEH